MPVLHPSSPGAPAAAHRCALLSVLLLLAVPVLQFGLTFWISVQGAAFLLVAVFVRKNLTSRQLLLFSVAAVAMLASLAGHLYADTLGYAFLRVVRQLLSLYIILCAAATVSWRPRDSFFDVLLPVVVAGLSAWVIVQYVTYTFFGWSTFFVPSWLLLRGIDTAAAVWLDFAKARGFLADIRVAGPYSEPSYFGFIALALAVLVVRGVSGRLLKGLLLALLFAALLCSKSASGVVLYMLLMLFAFRRSVSFLHLFGLAGLALLALLVAGETLGFRLLERLANIANPVLEPSGYTRLVLPFKHIALVFQHRPLGVPLSEFFTFTSQHLDAYAGFGIAGPVSIVQGLSNGVDNGFLNLFISFGWGAIVIVAVLVFAIEDRLTLVFLLFVCQFNGDFLSPDKVAVIALVASCRRAATRPGGAAAAPQQQHRRFTPPGPFGTMVPVRP